MQSIIAIKSILIFHQKIIFCSIISVIFFSFKTLCQCTTTPSLSAATFINDNSIGTSNFSSVSNASTEDGLRTVAFTTLSLLGSAKTNYLKATNFSFSIPPGATICGVSVWIKKRATGINIFNTVKDEEVKLVVDGTITGNNVANNTSWTGSDAFSVYGSTSSTWGNTLTRDQVNSSDFGVAIAAEYSGVAGISLSAEIDYITMQISYTPVLVPLIIGDFETKISENKVTAKWTMHEEEDDAFMYLQRSPDGRNWENLNSLKLHYHVGNHNYEYTDQLPGAGKYFYRLELLNGAGQKTYSKISSVDYIPKSKMKLYPNPVSSMITITNVDVRDKILIVAMDGKKIVLPHSYSNNKVLINVKNLNKGLYFVQAGNKIFSVVKAD